MPKVSTASKQYWYSLSAPLRDATRFVAYQGDNTALIGQAFTANTDKFLWKITRNADGTYNMVSKVKDSHINENSVYNTALKTQNGIPASGGWTFTPVYTNQYFAISNGGVQMNQTESGLSYQIYNWGGGSNTTDTGCQFLFRLENIVGGDALDTLIIAIDNVTGNKMLAPIGIEPGQYTTENLSVLNDAINHATSVKNNPASTQENYRNANNALQAAFETFKNSINLPLASNGTTLWYSLTAVRENRSVSYQGVGNTLLGETYQNNQDKFLWKLVELSDGTYSLVSKASGTENIYISKATPKLTAITGTQTSGGWKFTPIYKNNYFIISAGTSQFNQGNSGTSYAINNWGNGTNTTDEGCQYIIATRQVATDVQTEITADVNFWIQDRFLKSSGDLKNVKLFSVTGQQLDANRQLPLGIVIVKTNVTSMKLMVI